MFDRPKSSMHVELSKDARVISSIEIPLIKNRNRYEFLKPEATAPYFSFTQGGRKKRSSLVVNVDDNGNLFCLKVGPSGDIAFEKLDMQDSFSLTTDGGIISAHGQMMSRRDFGIEAPGAHFISDAATRWYNGGQTSLALPGGSITLAGSLESLGDVVVSAKHVRLPCPKTDWTDGQEFKDTTHWARPTVCRESDEHRVGLPPMLWSKQGNIRLSVESAMLCGAALLARKDIIAQIGSELYLYPQCFKHESCKTYDPVKGWFGYWVPRPLKQSDVTCDAALLAAGNTIEMTIAGIPYREGSLSGLFNKGIIEAYQNIIVSGSNGQSVLHNDLPQGERPAYHPLSFPLTRYLRHVELQASDHPLFFVTHPLLAHHEEGHARPLNEYAFSSGPGREKTALPTGYERMMFSFNLQAQALASLLFEHTGVPYVPEHRDQDFALQLIGLQDAGYAYALVNGDLEYVAGDGIPGQFESTEHELSQEEEQELEALIKELRNDNARNLDAPWLMERVNLIKSGRCVMTLRQEKIDVAPVSFIYYKVLPYTDPASPYNGEHFIVPFLHISQKDYEAPVLGSITSKDIDLRNLREVINKGTIHAIDKLRIQAHTVINQATLVKKYSVTAPLAGGNIVGFDVEIEIPQGPLTDAALGKPGITNIGGTVFGTHKVSFYAKQGDIVNKPLLGSHTVGWDPGFLGKVFGHKDSDQVIDYYPGRVTSEGDLELVAQAGSIINEASKIIAAGNANIKGLSGVFFKTLTSRHTSYSGAHVKGMSIEQITREAVSNGRSEVTVDGDLTVESGEGAIESEGGTFKVGKDAHFKAKEGNTFAEKTTRLTDYVHQVGFDLFGLKSVKETHSYDDVIQTEITTGGAVTFDSGVDNVLEAVIVNAGTSIHLIAQRDNIVKGVQENSSTTTDEWFLGVTFFGSESLQALADGDYKEALWALNDEDPLLASLRTMIDAPSVAQGGVMTVEALRLLASYSDTVNDKQTVKGMIGQRLGLTNADGNFSPTVRLKLAHAHKLKQESKVLRTQLNAQKVSMVSGADTRLFDGTQIDAETVEIEAKTLVMESAQDTVVSEATGYHAAVGPEGTMTLGGDQAKQESIAHHNAHIHANIIKIQVDDMRARGAEIKGNHVTIEVKNNLELTSAEDIYKEFITGAQATVGSNVLGGAYRQKEVTRNKVNEPSGIAGTESLRVVVGGIIELNGAFIESDSVDAVCEAQEIRHTDIHEEQKERGFAFGATSALYGSDDLGVRGTVHASVLSKTKKSIVRATIANKIAVKALESSLKELNRDVRAMREEFEPVEGGFQFIAPIVDTQKFAQRMGDIKQLFQQNTKESFDTLVTKIEEAALEQRQELDEAEWSLKAKLLFECVSKKKEVGQTLSPSEEEFLNQVTSASPVDPDLVEGLMREYDTQSSSGYGAYAQSAEDSSNEATEEINLDEVESCEPIADRGFERETVLGKEPTGSAEGVSYDIYEVIAPTGATVTLEVVAGIDDIDASSQDHIDEFDLTDGISFRTDDGKKVRCSISTDEESAKAVVEAYGAATKEEASKLSKWELWSKIVSLMLDITPVVGSAKSAMETVFGCDYITGRDLGLGERIMGGAAIAFPLLKHVKSVKILSRIGKWCDKVMQRVKATKVDKGSKAITQTPIKIAKAARQGPDGVTKEVAEKVAEYFKGTMDVAKTEKGWRVKIPYSKKREITVRLMEKGSGGRQRPYFRVSIDSDTAYTINGIPSDNPLLTHIDLSEESFAQIKDIANVILGRKNG